MMRFALVLIASSLCLIVSVLGDGYGYGDYGGGYGKGGGYYGGYGGGYGGYGPSVYLPPAFSGGYGGGYGYDYGGGLGFGAGVALGAGYEENDNAIYWLIAGLAFLFLLFNNNTNTTG